MDNYPMDNEKQNEFPNEDSWFDDLLKSPEIGSELGPDEQAMSSLGLTNLSDVELEKILQEAREENWGMEEPLFTPEPEAEPFRDQDYRDTFGEGLGLQQAFADAYPEEESPDAPDLLYTDEDEAETDLDEYYEEPGEYYEESEEYGESGEYYEESEEYGEPKEEPDRPVRKVRPKGKKGYGLLGLPHILSTFIWLAIIVAIGTSLGRLIWVCAAEVLAFGREEQMITVTITTSDDIDSIADKLQKAGLIQYPDLFKFYAALTDAEEEIIPGTFELSTRYDYFALVNEMSYTSESREEIEVMIPEGYTCEQIFALLEEKGVCSVEELEEWAANGELDDYWFLEGVERNGKYCLEGYLFPDTYRFYLNSTPKQALEKMLAGFHNSFDEDMIAHLDIINQNFAAMLAGNGYGQDYIDANKLTIREIVIIASMIEKESSGNAEGYIISSVIYNRLSYPSAFPFLNIDATLVYALGGKSDLTAEDKLFDSPYNTYLYPGLVPGAISNPGRASLSAALSPDETGYYYYALNPATNTHHFSSTLEEHEAFLESIKE